MYEERSVIVYILPRCPWPPYAGQTRLSFYRAKELRNKGYKVILIAFCRKSLINSNGYKSLKGVFDEIHLIQTNKIDFLYISFRALIFRFIRNLPLQSSWLNSPRILNLFREKISSIDKKYKNLIFHTYSLRSYFLWNIIDKFEYPFFIDLVDSMTLNLKRRCSVVKNLEKIFWKFELNSIKTFENNLPAYKYCKSYFVVSSIDKEYLNVNSTNNDDLINVSSVGYEMPEVLDTFKTENILDKNIIFFGSLSYEPNLSAIFWLIDEVMPLVWAKDSNIILNIAGRNPPKKLEDVCYSNNNLVLIPNPISMSDCIKKSIIALAPLVSGSGQQFKILEAMANGIPVIASKTAADPFGFINNKDLIIKDEPNSFANSLVELCGDTKKREQLSKDAFMTVKDRFSWKSIVDRLDRNFYEKY